MGGTQSDDEVAKAKGAMKEALALIVGDEEIRAESAASKTEGKADGKAPTRTRPAKPQARRSSTT